MPLTDGRMRLIRDPASVMMMHCVAEFRIVDNSGIKAFSGQHFERIYGYVLYELETAVSMTSV